MKDNGLPVDFFSDEDAIGQVSRVCDGVVYSLKIRSEEFGL
jgi:hypothetical protein